MDAKTHPFDAKTRDAIEKACLHESQAFVAKAYTDVDLGSINTDTAMSAYERFVSFAALDKYRECLARRSSGR